MRLLGRDACVGDDDVHAVRGVPAGVRGGAGQCGNRNACGVRLRDYPMTPDKVLTALMEAGL